MFLAIGRIKAESYSSTSYKDLSKHVILYTLHPKSAYTFLIIFTILPIYIMSSSSVT